MLKHGLKFVTASTALIILLTGCGSEKEVKKDIIRPVKTIKLNSFTNSTKREFTGKVKEAAEIKMAFRISGPIHKLPVEEGKFVKKGELLAEIDPRDYQVKLASAKARLKQLKAETSRVETLFQKKRVARNNYEKMVAARDMAEANYRSAVNALKDTKLRAPFSGYIQEKYYDNHEIVGAGTPVVSLVNLEYLEVETEIPSSIYLKRDKIRGYTCSLSTMPGRTFFLEPVNIRKKANFNQLYKVILKLEPEGDIKPAPGMTANIKIDIAESNTQMEIPVEALFSKNNQSHVWIYNYKTSTVKSVPVKTGAVNSRGYVKVTDGLDSGLTVVVAGVNSLKENQKVSLIQAAPATNVGKLL